MSDTDRPGRETTHASRQDLLGSLRQLSDEELVARLKGLAARERRATALLVAHLAELETRDVYLRAGYSSLFAYCRDVLALSEHEAYNRIEAARTARRFPVVLDLLAAGEVNLTTVRLLGPHLTTENHRGVLESARGRRKNEVEEIVARLAPRADVPASVRKLPEPKAKPFALGALDAPDAIALAARTAVTPAADSPASVEVGPAPSAGARDATAGALGPAAGLLAGAIPVVPYARRSAEVTPLSPDRYRYQLTISGATLEKLRLAKDLLRHALPSGDDEAILDRALTVLLTDLARKKFGAKKEAGVGHDSPVVARSYRKVVPERVSVRAEELNHEAHVRSHSREQPVADVDRGDRDRALRVTSLRTSGTATRGPAARCGPWAPCPGGVMKKLGGV